MANFDLILLPTSPEYIGTRVVICNTDWRFGEEGTVVIQLGGRSFFGTPKLEVGTRTEPIISEPVTVLEFIGGVMEFLAVPGYGGVCQWALVSNAANIRYFNGDIQDFNFDEQE